MTKYVQNHEYLRNCKVSETKRPLSNISHIILTEIISFQGDTVQQPATFKPPTFSGMLFKFILLCWLFRWLFPDFFLWFALDTFPQQTAWDTFPQQTAWDTFPQQTDKTLETDYRGNQW